MLTYKGYTFSDLKLFRIILIQVAKALLNKRSHSLQNLNKANKVQRGVKKNSLQLNVVYSLYNVNAEGKSRYSHSNSHIID